MNAIRLRRSGFTLIEIVIAAAIVLLLAGMVIPVFDGAVEDAQAASTRQILERARTAINFYAFQHDEDLPGETGGVWSEATLLDQLMMATDEDGGTAAPGTAGYPYGPYLTDDLGTNPFNELETILIVLPGGAMLGADDSTGWVYFAETGDFRANSTATAPDGDPVWEL
jgi:prepilin-type N-terminal cleavage/methylation domain-containing protein